MIIQTNRRIVKFRKQWILHLVNPQNRDTNTRELAHTPPTNSENHVKNFTIVWLISLAFDVMVKPTKPFFVHRSADGRSYVCNICAVNVCCRLICSFQIQNKSYLRRERIFNRIHLQFWMHSSFGCARARSVYCFLSIFCLFYLTFNVSPMTHLSFSLYTFHIKMDINRRRRRRWRRRWRRREEENV